MDFTKEEWDYLQKDYKSDVPMPDKVYFGEYREEDYEGYSLVIYKDKGKYYFQTGSHCSCYGLEGQWNPEEFDSKEVFLIYLNKVNFFSFRNEMKDIIKEVEADNE